MAELRQANELRQASEPRVEDPWLADPLQAVSSLLSQAEAQVSQAEAQANKIRAEATAFRAQAIAQAAATRESAEQEARELRASLRAVSAELSKMAAFVTQRLAVPAEPEVAPEADVDRLGLQAGAMSARPAIADRPGASRPAQQRGPGASRPATRPRPAPARERGTSRGTASGAMPRTAALPDHGRQSRQRRAARIMVAAMIGMVVFAAAAGTTEIALHGFPFFVFRSSGTGATPANGLQENQGPGQPDAPGAHHRAALRHHGKHHYHRPTTHHVG